MQGASLDKIELIEIFKSFTGEKSNDVIERFLHQGENIQDSLNYYYESREDIEAKNEPEKLEVRKELKFCSPFLRSNSEERGISNTKQIIIIK